jgi:hypothetical protein
MEKILIISTVILVLFANTSYHHPAFISLGLISAIVTIGIIHKSENILLWVIFVYVTNALLVIEMLIMVFLIIKHRKDKSSLKMVSSFNF